MTRPIHGFDLGLDTDEIDTDEIDTDQSDTDQSDDDQPDTDQPATEDQPDDDQPRGSEAARRRVQLRASEAQVAALQAQLAELQSAEVTRLAAGRLIDGQDLLRSVELRELQTDDDALSPELVEQAIDSLLAERPHLARPQEVDVRRHPVETRQLRNPGDPGDPQPELGWSDLLGGGRR